MSRRLLLLLPLLLPLLSSCGDDGNGGNPDAGPQPDGGPEICDPSACAAGQPGSLVLGGGVDDPDTGAVVFEPIEDGQEVPIVPGFQGGQHIWVVLRAENVQTCYVRPHYQILAEDDRIILDGRFGGEFYPLPGAPGTFEFITYAAFVSEPETIHGHSATLRAEVSDGCGHLIADTRVVVPIDPRLGDPTP